MVNQLLNSTRSLSEVDETAWLETTSELIRDGRLSEVDTNALAEYLCEMSKRDRREVQSRLVILLAHLLKWEFQPEHRSNSWRGTILTQRRELRLLLESGTLREHAQTVFQVAYQDARDQAAAETGLEIATFPIDSGWDLTTALDENLDSFSS